MRRVPLRLVVTLAAAGAACGIVSRRHVADMATLVFVTRQHGVVVAEVDELPVARDRGTWLTERLKLDPGPHVIELAYAYPRSGPVLQGGSAWGGTTYYANPRTRVQLNARPGEVYRLEQEQLSGGRWNARIVDDQTSQTVVGPVQVWPVD
jgi:hypothetical protein